MNKQKAIADAIQAHQSGDLTTAQDQYACILRHFPTEPDVLHLIGIAYGQTGDFQQSQYYLEQALRANPKSPSYHNSLAQVLAAQGDQKAAEYYYTESLALKPNNPVAHNNLGILHLKQQAYEQAEGHFCQAVTQKEDYADAYFNLGLTYLHLGKPEAARKQFEHCLLHEPQHPEANSQLGQLHQTSDHHDKAIKCYRNRLTTEPDHANTTHLLGTALLKTGDDRAAIAAFERTLELDPSHAITHHNLAAIYLLQNKLGLALEHWHQQLGIAPDIDTYYNLGVVYTYQDHYDEAIQYFTQALDQDDQHTNSHINLAAVYLKRNDIQQACFHYQQALKLEPDNSAVQYVLNALQQTNTGNYQQAPSGYVRDLFDQYAPHFDRHLSECLDYRAPDYCLQALKAALPPDYDQFATVVDLGCGSGLCGPLIKPLAQTLIGVDLSPKMLIEAEKKACYDQLAEGELLEWLDQAHGTNLFLAADVLPYLGDLQPLFNVVADKLAPEGYWVFTVEDSEQDGYTLTRDARFQHSRVYVKECLNKSGLTLQSCQSMTTRKQQHGPVIGLVVVAQKNISQG